jgi:hypothetical protein
MIPWEMWQVPLMVHLQSDVSLNLKNITKELTPLCGKHMRFHYINQSKFCAVLLKKKHDSIGDYRRLL